MLLQHPILCLLATLALSVGDDEQSVERARKALRPSLVQVCQRTAEHLKKNDWKRARLALTSTVAVARALDARWSTRLTPELERGLELTDAHVMLNTLVSIVYWDALDLITPLTAEGEMDPHKAKTRLLKAIQDLRYLAPLIRAPREVGEGEKDVDRTLLYSRLEGLLVNAARLVPSGAAYGQDIRWRADIRTEARRFLEVVRWALPELHKMGPSSGARLPRRDRGQDPAQEATR